MKTCVHTGRSRGATPSCIHVSTGSTLSTLCDMSCCCCSCCRAGQGRGGFVGKVCVCVCDRQLAVAFSASYINIAQHTYIPAAAPLVLLLLLLMFLATLQFDRFHFHIPSNIAFVEETETADQKGANLLSMRSRAILVKLRIAQVCDFHCASGAGAGAGAYAVLVSNHPQRMFWFQLRWPSWRWSYNCSTRLLHFLL